MIELKDVGKRYGERWAVAGVSLVIPQGKLVALIGPSGCGKTTTLKLINRLLEPTAGEIFVAGEEVHKQAAEVLRRKMGYVIQSIGLFPHMSVAQNIGVVPRLMGWPQAKRQARAEALLELVGLEPKRYLQAYPHELSGGQAQRVGVARALAVDPPIVLMDEPFGAVDPLTRESLQDSFLEVQRQLKKTVVMVTHDMDEAAKMADLICVMDQGRVVQYGAVEQVLAVPRGEVVRAFVGDERALLRLGRIRAGDLASGAVLTTACPLSVSAQTSVRQALAQMLEAGAAVAAVADAEGRVVGGLSLEAILDYFQRPPEAVV